MYRVAQFISIVFSPLTLIPLMFYFLVASTTATSHEFLITIFILYGLAFLPVVGSFIYLKQTKRISDWGIYKREERYLITTIALICGMITTLATVWLSTPYVTRYLVFLLAVGCVFAAITRYWKISVHTATVTLFVMSLVAWLGFHYTWLAALVLLVAWARVYQKKHTLTQAVAGIVLPMLLFWLVNQLGLL